MPNAKNVTTMKASANYGVLAKKLAAAGGAKAVIAAQPTDVQPKVRKPRAPLTEEAKAAMAAKRNATIAAKQAAAGVEPAADAESAEAQPKVRKPRAPMTEEAKAAMAAKRKATLAAKQSGDEPMADAGAAAQPTDVQPAAAQLKVRKPRVPLTEEARAIMAAKRKATTQKRKAEAVSDEPVAKRTRSAKALTPDAKPALLPGAPVKVRKAREPMTEEAKAIMRAKRMATMAAKAAAEAAPEAQDAEMDAQDAEMDAQDAEMDAQDAEMDAETQAEVEIYAQDAETQSEEAEMDGEELTNHFCGGVADDTGCSGCCP